MFNEEGIDVSIMKEFMIDCGCRLLGISTKYLLNASAITFGFVNVILFSITGEMTEFNDFFKDIRVLIPLHVFFRSLLA